jgi:hypothetical protein
MGHPKLAQQDESPPGKRDQAVFVPLGLSNMNKAAGTVDVGNLQAGSFAESQSAGLDGGQTDAIAIQPGVIQDLLDFFTAEDDGQFPLAGSPHEGQRWPLFLESLIVEELNAAQGNGGGASGVVLDVFQGEKIVSRILVVELSGRTVVVFRQLAYSSNVHFLSAFRHASKLQIFGHALS